MKITGVNFKYDSLKRLRAQKGITQEQLARELKITVKNISMYENGKQTPTEETAEKMADILGVSLNAIYIKTDNITADKLDQEKKLAIKSHLEKIKEHMDEIEKIIM